MAVKWKWKPAAGGAVSPDLTNRVQALETNAVKITGDQSIAGVKTFTTGIISHSSTEFGNEIKAGFGSASTKFIPEDNSTKNLQFYNANPTDQRRFNLLIAEPTEAQNPTTKQYVDNRIKYRTVNTNINSGSTYSVEPTSGYQVINVMVGRKRSNDGMYFFEYQTTLNKQVFWGSDNKFKIYNQGNVSGFSNNEFKILITEMKV